MGEPISVLTSHRVFDLESTRRQISDIDRDGLISDLLVATRRLARSRIAGSDPAVCEECQLAFVGDKQPHLETCRTGQVLDLLDRIRAFKENPTPIGKEYVQNEIPSCAKVATLTRAETEQEASTEFHEPWYRSSAGDVYEQIISQSEIIVAKASGPAAHRRRIAERIVACVNFCAGIPTSILEDEQLRADLILNVDCVTAVEELLAEPVTEISLGKKPPKKVGQI
jgi:hypothetical protein